MNNCDIGASSTMTLKHVFLPPKQLSAQDGLFTFWYLWKSTHWNRL